MLKGEIEILAAIALNKCTNKQIANNRIARSSTYITSTVDSLVRRGFIIGSKSKGYQLSPSGARVLLEFLPKNEGLSAYKRLLGEHSARAKEAINAIELLCKKCAANVEGSLN